jgi:hypothetical protein
MNRHLQFVADAVSDRATARSAAQTGSLKISLVFPSPHWNWQEKGMFVSAHLQLSIALQ